MTTTNSKIAIAVGNLVLLWTAFAHGAFAAESGAQVGVAALLALPEMPVAEFVGRASTGQLLAGNTKNGKQAHLPRVLPAKVIKPAISGKLASGQVAIQKLLGDGEIPAALLVAQTLGSTGERDISAAAVVVVAAKPAAKTKDVTVRVVIPMEPGAEPAAVKMATSEAIAKKPTVSLAAAAAVIPELSLDVEETATGLKVKPAALAMVRAGQVAILKVKTLAGHSLNLFVRDQNVVSVDQGAAKIKALKNGATELYLVSAGKMFIVPIKIEATAGSKWDLQVPDALVSLDGVFQEQMKSATFPGYDHVSAATAVPNAEIAPNAAADTAGAAPSLRDSAAELARAENFSENLFQTQAIDQKYRTVNLQIVDERSSFDNDRVYPVGGAQVRLIGTEFVAQTDETGRLAIRDMPLASRFLITIDDPNGAVRSAIAEVDTSADQGKTTRVRLMRSFSFDAYIEAAGAAQNTTLGSFCATIRDTDGSQHIAAAGISAELDAQADGPFYFNQYGLLDRSMHMTGADGRVCFFNVASGPIGISLYQNDAFVATVPFSAFAGRHVEESITFGHEQELETHLASLPTAHEQLGGDPRVSGRLASVDMVDLIPLGQDKPMMQIGPGHLSTSEGLIDAHGRVRALVQAADFEAAVYSYAAGSTANVTPLIPRGFVEDMAIYAQVSHDPALGAVVVDYGHAKGATDQPVTIHLVDQFGQDAGDGWYYSDAPETKAIFFNVPAGTYTLLVETKDQYWLGAETVIVYNETISYVRSGSALRLRP